MAAEAEGSSLPAATPSAWPWGTGGETTPPAPHNAMEGAAEDTVRGKVEKLLGVCVCV